MYMDKYEPFIPRIIVFYSIHMDVRCLQKWLADEADTC